MFTIIASSYERPEALFTFLACLKNQSDQDFKIIVVNDGPDKVSHWVCNNAGMKNLTYYNTDERFGDFGHTPRNYGLSMTDSDWILFTNHDNYYVPIFTKEINQMINSGSVDIITYGMITRGGGEDYYPLQPKLCMNHIDMGQFVTRRDIIIKAGGLPREVSFADGVLVERIVSSNPDIRHHNINKFLFVHN